MGNNVKSYQSFEKGWSKKKKVSKTFIIIMIFLVTVLMNKSMLLKECAVGSTEIRGRTYGFTSFKDAAFCLEPFLKFTKV